MRRFTIVLIVATSVGVIGAAAVLDRYGGLSFFPGLVSGFLGSLSAFMLALTWERERERHRAGEAARELEQRRATEVQRRLGPVVAELEKNAESLDDLRTAIDQTARGNWSVANPQLLDGAWTANAPRLSEVVADYVLIGDLATAYGRVEELRWRVRYRTEHRDASLDGMIRALVDELASELDAVLAGVRRQIERPQVQALGLHHHVLVSDSFSVSDEAAIVRSESPS